MTTFLDRRPAANLSRVKTGVEDGNSPRCRGLYVLEGWGDTGSQKVVAVTSHLWRGAGTGLKTREENPWTCRMPNQIYVLWQTGSGFTGQLLIEPWEGGVAVIKAAFWWPLSLSPPLCWNKCFIWWIGKELVLITAVHINKQTNPCNFILYRLFWTCKL